MAGDARTLISDKNTGQRSSEGIAAANSSKHNLRIHVIAALVNGTVSTRKATPCQWIATHWHGEKACETMVAVLCIRIKRERLRAPVFHGNASAESGTGAVFFGSC